MSLCWPLCTSTLSSRQSAPCIRFLCTFSYLTFLRQPLFVQSITGLKAVYEAKEVTIHIFGKKAEGELARPFQGAPGMFGGGYLQLQHFSFAHTYYCQKCVAPAGATTDAASIKAAEEELKKTK